MPACAGRAGQRRSSTAPIASSGIASIRSHTKSISPSLKTTPVVTPSNSSGFASCSSPCRVRPKCGRASSPPTSRAGRYTPARVSERRAITPPPRRHGMRARARRSGRQARASEGSDIGACSSGGPAWRSSSSGPTRQSQASMTRRRRSGPAEPPGAAGRTTASRRQCVTMAAFRDVPR